MVVNLYATLHTSPNLTFLCKHLTNLVCPVKRYGIKKLQKERKKKKKDRQTLRCGWDRRQITYTFPRPFLFGVSREVNGGGPPPPKHSGRVARLGARGGGYNMTFKDFLVI